MPQPAYYECRECVSVFMAYGLTCVPLRVYLHLFVCFEGELHLGAAVL